MVKLLIIADDFTGALDTGVQFAVSGAATYVATEPQMNYRALPEGVQVLVLDAETRHLSPEKAYHTVEDAVRHAYEAGIPYLYKKTDSALRGNIGAELAAVCDGGRSGHVHFIPAFPQIGRTTQNGIHYISGVPVSESVFGKDPFEPVRTSSVAEIVAQQSTKTVHLMGDGSHLPDRLPGGILVYDVENEAQMEKIAQQLSFRGELHACAGCAGFASALPHVLLMDGPPPQKPELPKNLLVVCGSVNPITVAQLDEAEAAGMTRVRLAPEQKLNPHWAAGPQAGPLIAQWKQLCMEQGACILDSNDLAGTDDTAAYAAAHGIAREQLRVSISTCMGTIVQRLLEDGLDAALMISGGDTLLGFMQQIGIHHLIPIGEMATGTVLSSFLYQNKTYYVISKSGGFGQKSLVRDLAEQIAPKEKATC